MNLEELQAFVTTAETSSFSGAAEKLHISQPAISKRIALLEESVGNKLFLRIKKRISLTYAGEQLLPLAKNILLNVQDAKQALNNLSGEIAGNLSIGFSHHIGLHHLSPYLKTFVTQNPQVNINTFFVDSEQAYKLVHSGEIELALVTLDPKPQPNLISTTLWRDPLHFVCAHNHQLHLQDDITLERLSELKAILPGKETFTGGLIEELFKQEDLQINNVIRTNYLETIRMMVLAGIGWGLLPKTMTGDLERFRISDVYLERSLGMISLKNRDLSNAAKAFSKCLLYTSPKLNQRQ